MPDRLDAATDAARARAALRAAVAARVSELIAAGHSAHQAQHMAGEEHGVSRGSAMRWHRAAVREAPIVDAATGEVRGRGSGADAPDTFIARTSPGRPPAAWATPGADEAWRIWRADYLRLEAPGSAACWRRVRIIARRRGWTIPSERSFRLRLRREVGPEEIVRLREGRVAALQLYPCQTRTVAGMAPLDAVSGDGKVHDVFVRMPSGDVIRPCTWVWQDVRTRRVLGWATGETESQDLVRMAFLRMADDAGCPRAAVIDNTRAASSKWWSSRGRKRFRSDEEDVPGILDLIGCRPVHTSVVREDSGRVYGWGQAKPVERLFGDWEGIDRHPRCAGAYTGRNPQSKPANYGRTAVDWSAFLDVVAEGIAEYNSREGRRMEAAGGRSIDETWAEEIAAVPVRRLTRSQRSLLLLACESRRVGRDGCFTLAAGRGVGLPPNRYFHEDLRALMHRRGDRRRVVARFDPECLHSSVEVYDLDGRWLCTAECIEDSGFLSSAAGREHNRERNRYLRGLQQAARAADRIEDLLDQHGVRPAAAPPRREPAPRLVEIVTPEKRRAAAAAHEAREDRFARGLRVVNSN